jgi:hypothetical protein
MLPFRSVTVPRNTHRRGTFRQPYDPPARIVNVSSMRLIARCGETQRDDLEASLSVNKRDPSSYLLDRIMECK